MELSKNKKQLGFTLLEMIIVILIVSIGILGAYGVYSRVFSYTGQSISSLQGTYLAQEGIEIVRNIRDTNWVNGVCWKTGLVPENYGDLNCASASTDKTSAVGDGCEADYKAGLTGTYTGNFLKISNGLYSYSATTPTKYQRRITITPDTDGTNLKVVSTVYWSDKGQNYYVQVQENIYDWWPSTVSCP